MVLVAILSRAASLLPSAIPKWSAVILYWQTNKQTNKQTSKQANKQANKHRMMSMMQWYAFWCRMVPFSQPVSSLWLALPPLLIVRLSGLQSCYQRMFTFKCKLWRTQIKFRPPGSSAWQCNVSWRSTMGNWNSLFTCQ